MVSRVRWVASSAVAVIAAVWWGVGVAVVQPATQPDEMASNNSYWARDVRFMLIVLTLAAFVWAVAGDRRRAAAGLAGAVVWMGADVALDRAEVAGAGAAVAVSAVAVAAVAGAWFAASRGEPRPGRGALVLASAVAAVVAGLGSGIQSPTDTEATLAVSGLLVGLLGAGVALGCVWTLAPTSRVAVFGALAVVLVVATRLVSPDPAALPLGVLLASMLVAVLGVRAMDARGVNMWAGMAVGAFALVLCSGAGAVIFDVVLPFGEPLTALAGNPPVNAADEDVLYTAVAVLTGLATGGVIAGGARGTAEPRPPAAA